MSGKKKDKHLSKQEIDALHQGSAGESGKGCIWSHEVYAENNQCSYRWHARKRAESESPDRYNYPAYKMLCIDDSYDPSELAVRQHRGRRKLKKKDNLRYPRKRPRPGQWDLSLPHNYAYNAAKPYFFNAHHIIPRSVLHDEIEYAGSADVRVAKMIKQGLLMASYNLNDRANLVNLPCDRVVALVMGFPRHLKGDGAYTYEIAPNESLEAADHPNYSLQVKIKIRPVINEYKGIMEEKLKKEHPAPPNALAAEKLSDISKKIYASIMIAGKWMKGKSLDEMRF